VVPRAGLDTILKKKIPSPRRESKPDHPIVQPVASRYTCVLVPVMSNLEPQVSLSKEL
jgi:hypothetical protein